MGLRDITKSVGYRGLGAFGAYAELVAKWQFNIGDSVEPPDVTYDGWRGDQNNQLVGIPISSGFPVPGTEPVFSVAVGRTHRPVTFSRLSGPIVVTAAALPPPILVVTFGARSRRLSETRRFPLAGFDAAGPLLGVREPAFTPTAQPAAAPIDVTLQAIAKRIADRRRQPLHEFVLPTRTGLPPPPVVTTLLTALVSRPRIEMVRRAPFSRLAGPVLVTAAPVAPAVRVELAPGRRPRTRSLLAPPATLVAASVTAPAIRVTVAPSRRPPAFSRLSGPIVVTAAAVAPAVRVELAPGRRPRSRSRLAPPATLTVARAVAFVRVTLAPSRRPVPRSRLTPPTVVIPPPTLQAQTVRVSLLTVAQRTWVDGPRRRAVYDLSAPTVLQTFQGPRVTLSGRTRVETARRRPAYDLFAPVVVIPLPTQQQTTLAVRALNVAVRTRLDAPRRRPSYLLGEPTVVIPPPALREQTVKVTLVRARPRRTVAFVRPAASAAATFAPVTVTLAAVRTRAEQGRHRPSSRLQPPTVLLTFRGPAVTIALRPTARRRPVYDLSAPTVVLPLPTLREQTIRRTLVAVQAARPRRTQAAVQPPKVAPAKVTYPPVTVTLAAVRARVELPRHRPVYRLGAPTVVIPLPTLGAQTVRVSLLTVAERARVDGPRRRPLYDLQPPTALRTFGGPRVTLAGRTRLEALRRAPRARLFAPAVVTPLPTAQQTTLRVWTLTPAERLRGDAVRRRPVYRLAPPTVVIPAPSLAAQTVRVTLTAVRTRTEQGRHRVLSHLGPPVALARVVFNGPAAPLAAVPARVGLVRRRPVYLLGKPTVIGAAFIPPPVKTQAVAVKTRADLLRRRPTYRLAPPTALQTFAGPKVTLVATRARADLVRRRPLFDLAAPTTLRLPAPVRVSLVALRPRLEAARRRPVYRLAPPAVVKPTPTLREQTVRVTTVAVGRMGLLRRTPRSHLSPPAVVIPPPPPVKIAIETVLVAVRHRDELRRRPTMHRLGPGSIVVPAASSLTILAASASEIEAVAASGTALTGSEASGAAGAAVAAAAAELEAQAASGGEVTAQDVSTPP